VCVVWRGGVQKKGGKDLRVRRSFSFCRSAFSEALPITHTHTHVIYGCSRSPVYVSCHTKNASLPHNWMSRIKHEWSFCVLVCLLCDVDSNELDIDTGSTDTYKHTHAHTHIDTHTHTDTPTHGHTWRRRHIHGRMDRRTHTHTYTHRSKLRFS